MVRKTRTGPIRQDTKEVDLEHQVICCYFSSLSRWPQHPPSQSEIFFLKAVIIDCTYVVAFQYQDIIVDCSLCSYVCIGLSRPNTLPKWNIFCYCNFLVCSGLSRQHPPSQSEIFFLKAVIIDCTYVVAFQYQDIIVDCSLCSYVCIGLSRPNTLPK